MNMREASKLIQGEKGVQSVYDRNIQAPSRFGVNNVQLMSVNDLSLPTISPKKATAYIFNEIRSELTPAQSSHKEEDLIEFLSSKLGLNQSLIFQAERKGFQQTLKNQLSKENCLNLVSEFFANEGQKKLSSALEHDSKQPSRHQKKEDSAKSGSSENKKQEQECAKNTSCSTSSEDKAKLKREIFRDLDHGSFNLRFNGIQRQVCNVYPSHSSIKDKEVISKKRVSQVQSLLDKCGEDGLKSKLLTRVLFVKGMNPANVSIQDLCNLFSNYGNVEKGIMHLDRKFALIQYSSNEGAISGLKHCNRLQVQGGKLSVFYSHLNQLQDEAQDGSLEQYSQDQSCKRFKNHVPKQANPVSRTLHVCIFFATKRRYVQDSELIDLLSSVATPVRIQRDTNTENLNMWFIEYPDQSTATEVLMKRHNLRFEEANLRISYTCTRRN